METVIKCVAGRRCSRVKNLMRYVEAYLRKFYGIEIRNGVCPVCGKACRDLYIHFKRSRCGGIVESLLREVSYIYRDMKRFCTRFTGLVYCRVCRRAFISWTDCLVHVIEEHPDYIKSYMEEHLS